MSSVTSMRSFLTRSSLVSAPTPTTQFLSRDACKALFDRILAITSGGGDTSVSIVSRWRGTSTWARNRVYRSSDNHEFEVYISRNIRGAGSSASTTRIDEDGLRDAVHEAERSVGFSSEGFEQLKAPVIDDPPLQPTLWSEHTAGLSADERAELARQMIMGADAAQLQSAGELLVGAEGRATITTGGIFRYYPVTTVEVSANVRDPKHGASGWVGVTDYDLGRVDTAAIAARALDKAQRSANPVALEPGRFTVILEPQAVADLFTPLLRYGALDRMTAESGKGPFAEPGGSKIGESVLDARLVFRADPMDPQAGFVPFEIYSGEPFRPVSWIDKGVLRELSYQRQYAFAALGLDKPLLNSNSYRLMPAEASRTTVDEMIQTTERGLLVTRFSDLQLVDFNSMLLTGFTRDGLWLIERGKISKAVKNFRFTESPLFALNNVEQIGTPVRVFDRNEAVVVPPIKVKDFSMTMLADAV